MLIIVKMLQSPDTQLNVNLNDQSTLIDIVEKQH